MAQWLAYLLPDLAAPGPIDRVPFFSGENNVDLAEINQQHCLEESGWWFENADHAHLVLQKIMR